MIALKVDTPSYGICVIYSCRYNSKMFPSFHESLNDKNEVTLPERKLCESIMSNM